jgi:hypothetical protein
VSTDTTPAERVDRAIDALLAGEHSRVAAAVAGDPRLGQLLDVAESLRDALVPPPVAARFEARLGARLAEAAADRGGPWGVRHPGRLLVAGAAVSSAAVGVGVTAYAVWRSTRRQSSVGHRLLHR